MIVSGLLATLDASFSLLWCWYCAHVVVCFLGSALACALKVRLAILASFSFSVTLCVVLSSHFITAACEGDEVGIRMEVAGCML